MTRFRIPHSETIRVDVGVLDRLMNLVGELVLARNQLLRHSAAGHDPAFSHTSQRLNLITTDIQKNVIKTRMQPIDNVWKSLPRLARDLAVQCGKKIELRVEGNETELDKSLLEAIRDPLAHLLRNAIDHGIEPPEERVRAGKRPEGRLVLRAYHEGGQVNIEMSDDGRGIDPERVRQKAIERDLIPAARAAQMRPDELLHLVFVPGFSTAAAVTSISGRGVGMDVVKTNIEKVGGSVELTSQVGRGSTIKLTIPLTLAIINALLVSAGGDRYAIPQVNLVELIRLKAGGVEMIHGSPVCRLRNQLLPLIDLGRELNVESNARDDGVVDVVVLRAERRTFGLVVAAINDTEEIVVKPVGPMLKGIPVYAGATILGDGRVALILDVLGLARRAGVLGERGGQWMLDETPTAVEREVCQTVLVFRAGRDCRLALPLTPVARLEEFPAAAIERSLGREVVQYRGHILPLLSLASLIGLPPSGHDRTTVSVIVCTHEGCPIGLVVDQVIDIIETPLRVQAVDGIPGVRGSAVLQGRVTDVLDVDGVLRLALAATDPRNRP